jgi:5-(carboxyamino)imidazole ribonucleotide synthase
MPITLVNLKIHVRAVCGLEQVPLKKLSNATMVNLIGDQISET